MEDSSHGSVCPLAVLDTPRDRCANRDVTIGRHSAGFAPQPGGAHPRVEERTPSTSAHVERAAAAQRWRNWITCAGTTAASTPVWTSRDGWLTALKTWAQSRALGALCAQERVSITAPTLLGIATVMAEHADHATGRHVAITRATIAGRVGCDVRTVTAAWRVLRAAKWAIEAQRGHGSPGTPPAGRRPSVYHLISRRSPTPAVQDFHLPPSGGVCSSPPVREYSPSARTARAARSATPCPPRRCCRSAPRPLGVQRLAGQLLTRCHGLDRVHVGAICDALTAAGIDPSVWSAHAITDALNTDMAATGWLWPDHIARPAAFLASRLRRLVWRPAGPLKRPEENPAGSGSRVGGGEHPPTLSAAQQARIAAARAEIRAVLTHRRSDNPSRQPSRRPVR